MSVYPHYLQNNIDCDNCHDVHGDQLKLISEQEDPQHFDDSPFNQLCWSCHCESGSETCYENHSSRQAADSYGNWTVQCVVCYEPHLQMQAITYTNTGDYVASGTIALSNVTATSIKKTGTASSGVPKTGGNYHLQSDSNCIDTGDATNAPADDIDGNSRPLDISGKGDGIADYDKGAYEYVP